jgi:hypothetical protein
MTTPKPLPSSISADQKRAIRLAAIAADAPSRLKLFERVYRREASPRQAIKAMCFECLNYSVEDIRTCTAPACPLHLYRPFQKREG